MPELHPRMARRRVRVAMERVERFSLHRQTPHDIAWWQLYGAARPFRCDELDGDMA